MTIERARELLKDLAVGLSDEEVQNIINSGKRFANVILDHVELKIQKGV